MYFKIQLKRMLMKMPAVLIVQVALILCLFFIGQSIIAKESDSQDKRKIRIALVGDTSESVLGIGVNAVKEYDVSNISIDYLMEYSEEEAKKALAQGDITAYAIIPENYVGLLNEGQNPKIKYATCNDNSGLATVMVHLFMDTLDGIMRRSQGSIYAAGQVVTELGFEQEYWPVTGRLFLLEMETILNREQLYEIIEVGNIKGLGYREYYFVALFIFLLLLYGIAAVSYFCDRNPQMHKMLKAKGVSALWQVLAEYSAFLLAMGVIACVCMKLMGLYRFIDVLPGLILLGWIEFFIYELCQDLISGVMLQFMVAVVLSFLSGFLYPISSFDVAIQKIAPFLPTGAMLEYMSGRYLDQNVRVSMITMVVYIILFAAGTVGLRRRRICR